MKKVLIVEDEEALSEIYATAIEKYGFQTTVVNTVAHALDNLSKNKPDLILLDIKLPDASGLVVLQKTREQYPKMPVIICTAFDQEKLEQTVGINVLINTATDYLIKPVKLNDLTGKIKTLLGQN
ncbi:MAG: hypothetical protein A2252_03450 [Elusimicrobia bacterium RIFOXYA2_FULL_39_19]|nr:MAG: hypothetical protein A2252_03450 [Elusimicrobia bacterium RIFOXYA2_FULL_39_19]